MLLAFKLIRLAKPRLNGAAERSCGHSRPEFPSADCHKPGLVQKAITMPISSSSNCQKIKTRSTAVGCTLPTRVFLIIQHFSGTVSGNNSGVAIDHVKKLMPEVTPAFILDAGHLVSMDQPARVNQQMLKFLG
jgi:hypothetical protein